MTPPRVVEPTSVQAVADIMRQAAADGHRVTPVGAGTEAGGDAANLILSTRKLAGVEVYEPADLTITAGAGTTLSELGDAVGEHGQWVPLDPPNAPNCTLGGVVATGVGGPLWAGYGAPRDHVLGLTLVTGTGRILKLGGRVMKNVAGFDLVRLAVGSRGSLGVITSACIRVFPRPEADRLLVLEGAVAELAAAGRAVATAPVMPVSAVITHGASGGIGALVVRLHGRQAVVDADASALSRHVGQSFQAVEPEHHDGWVAAVRDAPTGSSLRLGLSVLPACLPELLSKLNEHPYVADVMAGTVAVAPSEATEDGVRSLVRCAEDLGGGARLISGPPALADVLADAGPAHDLAERVRSLFDPQGVLSRRIRP